jgi:hypothetical protein
VEIQPLQTGQSTKIDIYRSAKPVPACKSLSLLTLDVPQGIAYVLEIEAHATLKQARPLAAPVSEEMPVRALTGLVAVRAAERFLLQSLGVERKRKYIQSAPQ